LKACIPLPRVGNRLRVFFLAFSRKGDTMARPMNYPINIGVRLSLADCSKLEALCTETDLAPSEIVRWLIRTTDPGAIAHIRGAVPARDEVLYAALDGASVGK